jgi:hypothetical protein
MEFFTKKSAPQYVQYSLITCILINALFTVLKDTTNSVKELLVHNFGNHWVGQLLFLILLFPVLTMLFKAMNVKPFTHFGRALVFSIVFSILLLTLFFISKYSYHTNG